MTALLRSEARIERGAADFGLVDVAARAERVGVGPEHLAEVADAAGGERLDRAGGDGVDADVLAAQV